MRLIADFLTIAVFSLVLGANSSAAVYGLLGAAVWLRFSNHRVVPAAVVHQDDFIHDALFADFIHGFGDGLRRVVGGHHHHDFLFEIHWLRKLRRILPQLVFVLK